MHACIKQSTHVMRNVMKRHDSKFITMCVLCKLNDVKR